MRRPLIVGSLLLTAITAAPVQSQSADTMVQQVQGPVYPKGGVLTRDRVLGAGANSEMYEFSEAFLHPGQNGHFFVVDVEGDGTVGALKSSVRQFNNNGTFVRAFGRSGAGPGEYAGAVGDVTTLPDGTVLIRDRIGVLVYAADGTFKARWKLAPSTLGRDPTMHVHPAGFVFVKSVRFTPPARGASSRPTTSASYTQFRFNGDVVDSALTSPEPAVPSPLSAYVPFQATFLTAWSPQGHFVTAWTGRYAIDLRLPDNAPRAVSAWWRSSGTVQSWRRAVPAVPVQSAERADWIASVVADTRRATGSEVFQWSGDGFPANKPPIRALFVDQDSRVWVKTSQPAELQRSVSIRDHRSSPGDIYVPDAARRWKEPQQFDVYEANGRLLGSVVMPDRFWSAVRPQASVLARGNTVWVLEKDQDDVPVIARYQLSWR